MTWNDILYFQPQEFDSHGEPGTGEKHMNLDFVHLLDKIREKVGFPLIINSGYRSPEHNVRIGGVKNSAHMRGLAADIKTDTWERTFEVIRAALELGIRRVGVAANGTYVHVDIDSTLPHPRMWFYP